jgi:PAS domain S-box-containing protein
MREHAIVMADVEGVIRVWNDGAEVLLGHGASEAIGQSLDLIIPESFRDAHWRTFRKAMQNKELEQPRAGVLPLRSKSGEVVPLLGTLSLVKNGSGAVIGAMGVFVETG